MGRLHGGLLSAHFCFDMGMFETRAPEPSRNSVPNTGTLLPRRWLLQSHEPLGWVVVEVKTVSFVQPAIGTQELTFCVAQRLKKVAPSGTLHQKRAVVFRTMPVTC
jgi:hypothetical protein